MYIEYVAGLLMHVVWQAAYAMAQSITPTTPRESNYPTHTEGYLQ